MLAFCHGLKHVRVKGLMTMALRGDLQSARATFADLAILRDTMNSKLAASGMADMVLHELSMGMSDDYLEPFPKGLPWFVSDVQSLATTMRDSARFDG